MYMVAVPPDALTADGNRVHVYIQMCKHVMWGEPDEYVWSTYIKRY